MDEHKIDHIRTCSLDVHEQCDMVMQKLKDEFDVQTQCCSIIGLKEAAIHEKKKIMKLVGHRCCAYSVTVYDQSISLSAPPLIKSHVLRG